MLMGGRGGCALNYSVWGNNTRPHPTQSHRRVGCWNAHIWYGQRDVYLGSYENEHHAARVYDIAALKCRGLAAQLNYPLDDYEKVLDLLDAMDTVCAVGMWVWYHLPTQRGLHNRPMQQDTMMLLVRTCGYPADRVGRHVRNKQPVQQEPPMSSEEFLENVTSGLQRYLDEGQATAAAAVIAARSGKTLPFLQTQQDKASSEENNPEVEDVAIKAAHHPPSYGSDYNNNNNGPATDSGGRLRRPVRSRQHSAMWKDFVVGEDAMPRTSSRDGMSSDGETSSRQPRTKRPGEKRKNVSGGGNMMKSAKMGRIGSVATVSTGPLKAAWGPLPAHPTMPRGSSGGYYNAPSTHCFPALLNPPPLPRRRGPRYVGGHDDDYSMDGDDQYPRAYHLPPQSGGPPMDTPFSPEASPMARKQATVEALMELQQQPPREVVDVGMAAAAAAEAAAREAELMFLREQNKAQSRQLETLHGRVRNLEAQLAQAMVQQSMLMKEGIGGDDADDAEMDGGHMENGAQLMQKKKIIVDNKGSSVNVVAVAGP